MIDVDHFKQINDAYGHTVGDAVLREVARRIRAGCRVSDVAGRYGGEEFTLLLPDTDLQGAVAVAEKLRGVVSAAPVRAAIAGNMVAEAGDATVDVSVRVSVGVAARQPTMLDPESLYAAADNGLYRAKEAGRDHVSVAPTSGAPRGGGPA